MIACKASYRLIPLTQRLAATAGIESCVGGERHGTRLMIDGSSSFLSQRPEFQAQSKCCKSRSPGSLQCDGSCLVLHALAEGLAGAPATPVLVGQPHIHRGGRRSGLCVSSQDSIDSTARFHPAKQNLNLHATCPSDRRSCSWSLRCCRLRPALSGFGMKWRWPPGYESAREHSSRSRPDSPHSPQQLETSESDHPRATATRPVLKTSIET